MPRVTFTADFDWYPPAYAGRYLQAYKAGFTLLVTTPCAAAAIAAGRAVRPKDDRHGEVQQAGEPAAEDGRDAAGGALGHKAGPRAGRRRNDR